MKRSNYTDTSPSPRENRKDADTFYRNQKDTIYDQKLKSDTVRNKN